jgi:3-phenylpropionate/trans-cinnamate dioxygenase ferredoxin component
VTFTGEFTEVARTGDLAVGAMKKVCIDGRELLLARTAVDFYCTDNRCPHLNGDLSRGTLTGTVVTCPDHNSQFDLNTGAILRWTNLTGIVARLDQRAHPPKPLATYAVKIEGGRVFVRLP